MHMDIETRGSALRRRRLALGIKSINDLHKKSGVSREAITAAEAGSASSATYQRLEAFFDRFEDELGMDVEVPAQARPIGDPADDLIEVTIQGNFGVRAVVKGPVRDLEALQAAVSHIIADMQSGEVREAD